MPPKDKLSDRVTSNFSKWILMGAPDPRKPDKPNLVNNKIDLKEGRKFWSFIPPANNKASFISEGNWTRSEIDKYIWQSSNRKIFPLLEMQQKES